MITGSQHLLRHSRRAGASKRLSTLYLIMRPIVEDDSSILGLTHPNRVLIAATNLWKRRGALTSAISSSNWVERLVVLTETSLLWFDKGNEGADGLGAQHGRIELRHIQAMRPIQPGGSPPTSVEELEHRGPMFQLEIAHVMSDHMVLVGGTDEGLVRAWHTAIEEQIQRTHQPIEGTGLSLAWPPPDRPSILRVEQTGILAMGMLGKMREAMTGIAKETLEKAGVLFDKKKHGWSTRMVVLTEHHIWFYKPVRRKQADEDDLPPFGGVGSTLRTGDYIFGRETGKMPLASADVSTEKVVDTSGETCACPGLSAALFFGWPSFSVA